MSNENLTLKTKEIKLVLKFIKKKRKSMSCTSVIERTASLKQPQPPPCGYVQQLPCPRIGQSRSR